MSDFDDRVLQELVKIKGLRVELELDGVQAFMLIAQLQLALRHPANQGDAATLAVVVAKKLQDRIAPNGLLREVINMGWDPAKDEPREEG